MAESATKPGESKIPDEVIAAWETLPADAVINVNLRKRDYDALLIAMRQLIFAVADLGAITLSSRTGDNLPDAKVVREFDGNIRAAMDNVNSFTTAVMTRAGNIADE